MGLVVGCDDELRCVVQVLSRALEYLTPKDPDYKQMKMLQMQAMKRGGLNEVCFCDTRRWLVCLPGPR